MQISSLKSYRSMQCIACVCNFKVRNLIVRCDLKQRHFTKGPCCIPGSTSGGAAASMRGWESTAPKTHSYSKRYPLLTLKRLKRFKRFKRFQTPLFQNPKIQENRGSTFKIKAKVKIEIKLPKIINLM